MVLTCLTSAGSCDCRELLELEGLRYGTPNKWYSNCVSASPRDMLVLCYFDRRLFRSNSSSSLNRNSCCGSSLVHSRVSDDDDQALGLQAVSGLSHDVLRGTSLAFVVSLHVARRLGSSTRERSIPALLLLCSLWESRPSEFHTSPDQKPRRPSNTVVASHLLGASEMLNAPIDQRSIQPIFSASMEVASGSFHQKLIS